MWISVFDQLPTERKVIAHYYTTNLRSWVVDVVQAHCSDGKAVFSSRNGKTLCGVTHWMPLPAPPTADNVEGANLQHTTAPCQNGTAGKPQVGECTTSA